jgi:hypothetical protein
VPRSRRWIAIIAALAVAAPAAALASSGSGGLTVAPSKAVHLQIIKAFGAPATASSCLITRLAAANQSYADVRFNVRKQCSKWAFNGVNVLERVNATRWRILFEGSSYKCPVAHVPAAVQRDLGVCPQGT